MEACWPYWCGIISTKGEYGLVSTIQALDSWCTTASILWIAQSYQPAPPKLLLTFRIALYWLYVNEIKWSKLIGILNCEYIVWGSSRKPTYYVFFNCGSPIYYCTSMQQLPNIWQGYYQTQEHYIILYP